MVNLHTSLIQDTFTLITLISLFIILSNNKVGYKLNFLKVYHG